MNVVVLGVDLSTDYKMREILKISYTPDSKLASHHRRGQQLLMLMEAIINVNICH